MKQFSQNTFFLLAVSFLSLFVFLGVIFADNEWAIESVKPAGFFEKVGEKLGLFLNFDREKKVSYFARLTNKRLGELKYVIETKNYDGVEVSSSRYSTYVLSFADLAVANLANDKRAAYIGMLESQKKEAERLRDVFAFESGWWLSLSHSVNSAQIVREKISN